MGGKSTFLRQNAIMYILAQSGLYVPAASAQLGIVVSTPLLGGFLACSLDFMADFIFSCRTAYTRE